MQKYIYLALSCLLFLLSNIQPLEAQKSVARRWNEVMLEAIREDLARPPVQARNLFHVSMAMWDAWAAYDTLSAETYLLGKTVGNFTCQFDGVPAPPDREAARREAVSFAAYRLLARRFQNSPNAGTSLTRFRDLMTELGYDWTYNSNFYQSGDPAALGNYIGDCVSFYGLTDGANEQGNYGYVDYAPVNPPLRPDSAGNPTLVDPNRWQPLILSNAVDQQGNPIPALQRFQSPEWGRVYPFAIPDSAKVVYVRDGVEWPVYHDPGLLPILDTVDGGGSSEEYKWNFNIVSIWSSHLTPEDSVMWDISPATIGNTPWLPTTFQEYQDFYQLEGGGPSLGRPVNPKTGLPYPPQIVPRGDYARVLAQFWADGPNSETPPGHWYSIFNKVMDHPEFVRKYNGAGEILDSLEYDLKAYFTLGGALHDAAVSAWGIKGWYDGIRPISALRWMADRGQSSDPAAPNYNVAGIKLVPGYIEQIQSGDPLAGPNDEHVGKIKVYAWQGHDSISNPATDIAGVGWILAERWWPTFRKTFVTPPFAGYISGHSTYSRAAAEALTLLTGDEYFPGGVGEFHIAANSGFLGVEKGPSVDVTLQWATYRDASDQTSLSRIWGGIHPPVDDIPGRRVGAQCGIDAFYKAKSYFYSNDVDSDGYNNTVDCDDHNPAIHPNAADVCDGIDNDCDGLIDEGLTVNTFYPDVDGDGFGDANAPLDTCLPTAPVGYVTNNQDCFDFDAGIYPGAQEVCDGLDNNCNGLADDGLPIHIFYQDNDGDGYGNPNSTLPSCSSDPIKGFVNNDQDCDDNNAAIYPGAAEVCDELDNDCNGFADDGLEIFTYFADADGDGQGDADVQATTCLQIPPAGFVGNDIDCDDSNAAIYSGATEICDAIDNDCDLQIDEGLPNNFYYVDADGDGFGDSALPIATCFDTIPIGYVANSLDCDDSNALVNPDGLEGGVPDSLDNDCNGLVDDIVGVSQPVLQARVYPNPVQDVLTIEISDSPAEAEAVIIGMDGRVLRSKRLQFGNYQATLRFAGLPRGVYFLRIADPDSGRYWVQRVVKM
ncbi:MAG: MopE-related protein [Saprospiraceae bacterium]|nr:MopE-related protein [Saprospiraceae bacterium]